MSLNFQPTVTSTLLNGLPAQPVEGAATQPLSFEEVLKVEEKKLQQEINNQSAAALLATIGQPATSEPIHGFEAGNLARSAQSVDQTALTVDSAQTAATQPMQNSLLPQHTVSSEMAAEKPQSGFSVPTIKAEQTVEAKPGPLLKSQTEAQPLANEAVYKRPVTTDESQGQPATTFAANIKAMPVSTLVVDAENLQEKTGSKFSIRKRETVPTSRPASFKTSTTHSSEASYVVENMETLNLSQFSLFTVSDASEAAPADGESRNIFVTEIKPAIEPIQTNASDLSVPHPAEKAENPAAKIPVKPVPFANVDNAETDQKIPTDEKTISLDAVEQKQAMPVQADIESDSGSVLKSVILNNGASTANKEVSLPQQRSFVADAKSNLSEDVNISAEKSAAPVRVVTSENEPSQSVAGTVVPKLKSPAPEIDTTKDVTVPTVKFVAHEIDNEPNDTKTKMAAPVQEKGVFASEISQPAKKTVVPTPKAAAPEISDAPIKAEKKLATPAQVKDISANEMSQPVKETVVPTVKAAAPEISDAPIKAEKKMPIQVEDVPASEISQPAKETVVPTVKVAASETDEEPMKAEKKMAAPVQAEDVPAKETVVSTVKVAAHETGDEPMKAEKKMATPVQVEDVPANEIPQPAKETVVPTVKAAASETDEEPIKAEKKMATLVQVEDVPANETPQPAKETVVLTPKAAAPETSEEPIKIEKKMAVPVHVEDVPASEMSQLAKETISKRKDDKAAPLLEFDNATAESRLGMGSRPQIKNEAIVFEQGNAPVDVQTKKVEQSARVEITSDEKVSSKESTLDLESNVVIAGNEKGVADVVKRSFVAQVDPMAREVVEQITSQVNARIKSGETSIRIKLNPEKLGEIEVQMTHSAKGVSVSFITEQASTGQLIESQVNQLRQSLKDAGVQLANLNISQHGQSYQEGGGFRQSQQFVQTSRRDVPLVEADEGIQPQRVGPTSEIDYLV